MTLSILNHHRDILKIAWFARALDMPPITLYKRLERGHPELSPDEVERIQDAMRRSGFKIKL